MKYTCFSMLFLQLAIVTAAQPVSYPARSYIPKDTTGHTSSPPLRTASSEICNNNMDDDGNGLTDENDPTCYFSQSGLTNCKANFILWACISNGDLVWTDVASGTEHRVGHMSNGGMLDITWGSDGKLYGVEGRGIWEIDPNTADAKLKGALPPQYAPMNAMCADGYGNLYLTAYLLNGTSIVSSQIIKINIATWQTCFIADIGAAKLPSGGDLTFLNGKLYLACGGSVIARVDLQTGNFYAARVTNAPFMDNYGLASCGDGYIYGSNVNKIYRIDPNTMVADAIPAFAFGTATWQIYGLANYAETCHAPQCMARIHITPSAAPPYCRGAGVTLQSTTDVACNAATGTYSWVTPAHDTIYSNTVTAVDPGMYYARYHVGSDTCSAVDSFLLTYPFKCGTSVHIQPSTPSPYCKDAGITLQAMGSTSACKAVQDSYKWTTPAGDIISTSIITPTEPGLYIVKYQPLPDTCTGVDSFRLQYAYVPVVDLGKDTSLCSDEELYLSLRDTVGILSCRWQDGYTGTSFLATQPGLYWVEVRTACGLIRDSIYIQPTTAGCDIPFFAPTAFTPNNDGYNDVFRPIVRRALSTYELIIYNRWGQMIFKTNDVTHGWDGTIHGQKQDTGVYSWVCRYGVNRRKIKWQRGTVMLIQ